MTVEKKETLNKKDSDFEKEKLSPSDRRRSRRGGRKPAPATEAEVAQPDQASGDEKVAKTAKTAKKADKKAVKTVAKKTAKKAVKKAEH